MKKQSFALLFLLFVISVSAHINEAVMFDQLDSTTTCEDLKARLDFWAIEQRENPESTGYAVVYEGKYFKDISGANEKRKLKTFLPTFGESVFRTSLMQEYMFKVSKFSRQKFIFIDGGFRENYTVELYIIPKGALPPTASPTLETIKYRSKPTPVCDEPY